MRVFSPVPLSDEVLLGEALDGRPGKGFVLPAMEWLVHPLVLPGRVGFYGTIVTVIVGIALGALWVRVAKHDLYGASLLNEVLGERMGGRGILIEPCVVVPQSKVRSLCRLQGLVTRSRSLSNCRSHAFCRSGAVPRGLCSGSRAAQKDSLHT